MPKENDVPPERRLIILKPDAVRELKIGELITKIEAFANISRMIKRRFADGELEVVYGEHIGRWYWQRHYDHMTSGDSVIIEAIGSTYFDDLKSRVREGRTNPENLIHIEDTENPELLEFLFG